MYQVLMIWAWQKLLKSPIYSLLLLSSLLGGDHVNEFISLMLGSSLSTEFSSGKLDSSLFFGLDTGSNQFNHSLFKWSKSSNFSNEFSDASWSLWNSSLSENWSLFPLLAFSEWDNHTSVKSNEITTFAVSVWHVFL